MAKRRNTKRRKRGKGPKSKQRSLERVTGIDLDEVALRKAFQDELRDGATKEEVYQTVRSKVDKIAREHLPGRSEKVVAMAAKDVEAKLMAIAREELNATDRITDSSVQIGQEDQINDFVRVQLLKGVDPDDIEQQVRDRWGSVADNSNWRQTAYHDRAQQEGDTPPQSSYPPINYKPKPRGTPQEQTVEYYMEAVTSAYGLTKQRGGQTARQQQEAIFIWRCLRDARVFHFEQDTYVGLYQEIDRYVTEELSGLTYRPPDQYVKDLPQEEVEAYQATILRESKSAAYPEKFPFECVFMGYGEGIQMNEYHAMASAPQALRDRVVKAVIVGHLMMDDGWVFTVVKGMARALTPDGQSGYTGIIWFEAIRSSGGGWVRSNYHLEPWILPSLIKIINDHRTFILENAMGVGLRKDYKRNRKGMGIKPNKRAYTPPPYYTLRMKSKLVREKVRKSLPKPPAPKTYKTDVRAHERCRIARGPLPLDPETGAKLRKRGYKMFTTNSLDLDTYRRLHERGLPYKKADEWLAILVTWVEEHMTSNDPHLPYIPAVRVPGEVRLKPRQPTGGWVDDPRS